MRPRTFAVAFLILVPLVGCSKSSPTGPSNQAVTIVPADGATGVPTDLPITMSFGVAVDRGTVERGFHLISEYAMTNHACPDSLWHYHGSMGMVMGDPGRMHHMDEFHSTTGQFDWGANETYCRFRPDSLLRSRTQYMIHFDRDMVNMMESRMGHRGGMGDHHPGMMSGDMMFHYTTGN